MKRELFVVILATLLLIPAVSASLTVNQPNNLYTFGDTLSVNVGINKKISTNDYLSVSAICSGAKIEIYRAPLSVKAGQQKSVAIEALIDSSVFSSLQGDCVLLARYNDEQTQTQTFQVKSDILVNLQTAGNVFEPSDSIKIMGTATRANGNAISGTTVISIENTNISVKTSVANGSFSSNLTLPSTFASGGYTLNARVYDFDDAGNALNKGTGEVTFRVKQVIREVEVALSDLSIMPGNKTNFNVVLYDQASMTASENVRIELYNPTGQLIEQIIVPSGEYQTIKTETNYSPGYWTIVVAIGKLNGSKQFYVSEYSSIKKEMDNTTLIITNTGNIIYQKLLQVDIGGISEIIQLNVPVNGIQKLKLSAPDGSYAVGISDGTINQTFGSVFLTGKAVSIIDSNSQGSIQLNNIFWVIIIIIGLVVIIYYYRKISRDRNVYDIIPSLPSTARKREAELTSMIQTTSHTRALQSGVKKEVSIVALKIKNYDSLLKVKSPALETIAKTIKIAKDSKAVITNGSSSILMYFSDATIKTGNINLIAVKAAKEIENLLKSHNRKYAQKIDFGIGVHNDTFIVENSGGSWKFTALGTGLSRSEERR